MDAYDDDDDGARRFPLRLLSIPLQAPLVRPNAQNVNNVYPT